MVRLSGIGLEMSTLERVEVENRLRWFELVKKRHVDSVVRRADQMKDNQITRGRGRPKKL